MRFFRRHFFSPLRFAALLGLDAALAGVSLVLAYALRFEGELPAAEWQILPPALALLVGARLTANLSLRLHRWSFRFAGLTDGARVALAGVLGTGLWTVGLYFLRLHAVPRAVVVMELLLTVALMTAMRFGPRLGWLYRANLLRARQPGALRTLIVGAGQTGELVLRDLQRSTDHLYQVLGFVDERPDRQGEIVAGTTVLGTLGDLPRLASRFGVEVVLIAAPELPARRLRKLLLQCADLKLRFKIVPASYRRLSDENGHRIQDLEPSDLLERDELRFAHPESQGFTAGRPQLVAGAAGSIGAEVCRQLLELGCRELVMLDINESALYLQARRFRRRYPDRRLTAELADIRDVGRLRSLFAQYRPRDVFHAAACKHVPLMESAPGEAVKTNVQGTRLLAQAAHDFSVERFVFMSTDKAVRPSSVMGATKRLGELVVRQMDAISSTRFSVVRFGNVLDSAGSVVPIFREQIKNGGPVTVTHPEARRFFMTISEAVGLVLKAAYGGYGQLCVLEMGEPIRILDLARHMIVMSGQVPDVDVKIELSGLRPGEKLQEELLDEDETVLRHIDRKVAVVESPPPPENLWGALAEIEAATAREDADAVLGLLRGIVPGYASPRIVLTAEDDTSEWALPS